LLLFKDNRSEMEKVGTLDGLGVTEIAGGQHHSIAIASTDDGAGEERRDGQRTVADQAMDGFVFFFVVCHETMFGGSFLFRF
jgi:hypothetical protein